MKIYGQEKTNSEIIDFVQKYDTSIHANRRDRFHDILSLISPSDGGRALDYGCGWGCYSIAMRGKGYDVDAIDISKNEIDICRLVWGGLDKLKFTYNQITSFEKSCFDIVLSNQVIEHVHNAGTYLSGINRVLKNGGHLIIALPNVINPRFIFGLLKRDLNKTLATRSDDILSNYNKTHDHINAWDPSHFVSLCASVGFKFEKYVPMEGVAFPFSRIIKPYLFIKNRRIRNLSYTMAFRFKKEKEITINQID